MERTLLEIFNSIELLNEISEDKVYMLIIYLDVDSKELSTCPDRLKTTALGVDNIGLFMSQLNLFIKFVLQREDYVFQDLMTQLFKLRLKEGNLYDIELNSNNRKVGESLKIEHYLCHVKINIYEREKKEGE